MPISSREGISRVRRRKCLPSAATYHSKACIIVAFIGVGGTSGGASADNRLASAHDDGVRTSLLCGCFLGHCGGCRDNWV